MLHIHLPAKIEQLSMINAQLEKMLTGNLEPLLMKTQLVVEELLVNICNYSYEGGSGWADFFCAEINFDGKPHIMIQISDSGKAFDPFTQASAPDLDADVEKRRIGGLGIHFVTEIAAHYYYVRRQDTNQVTIFLALEDEH